LVHFAVVLIVSVPCVLLVRQIRIDTDLLKLLPADAPSVLAAKELESKVGDGGHFIVTFEVGITAGLCKLLSMLPVCSARLTRQGTCNTSIR
jgi:predicted RND superfamily exporter protein